MWKVVFRVDVVVGEDERNAWLSKVYLDRQRRDLCLRNNRRRGEEEEGEEAGR